MGRSGWVACFAAVAAAGMGGCRRPHSDSWSLVVDNRSGAPCEVSLQARPGARVFAPDIAVGERRVLLSGRVPTMLEEVRLVVRRKERSFRPGVEVAPGRSYLIRVGENGEPKGEVVNP